MLATRVGVRRSRDKMPTKKHRVYASLEPTQAKALRAIAKNYRVPMGWLVMRAVERLLEAETDPLQFSLFVDLPRR